MTKNIPEPGATETTHDHGIHGHETEAHRHQSEEATGTAHGHEHGHGHGHGHGGDDVHDHGKGILAKVKHVLVPHSHDPNEAIQSAEEASGQGIRAAWIGLAGMMATAIAQLAIVAISGSIALLADTIHNLGHAATTIPLILAFRIGRRQASKRYTYGYRRAEDLVGLFIGLIIAVSAGVILWESVDALINPREITNLEWVFAAGIVGFLGNEIVAIYRIRSGRRIGSAALIAEGQHARADGLTSIAVVLGVLGVWWGFERADAIVGFLIGLAILGILISSMRTVGRRLMDGVDDDLIDRLAEAAVAVPGVEAVENVRARWSGHRMEGDLSIEVAADLNVIDAHAIADRVEHEILHTAHFMERAVVHVHPVVPPDEADKLHELSGHHASAEARRDYLARLADGESHN